MKLRHILLSASLTVLLNTPSAFACGPSFVEPIFTFVNRPENFADFAKGNLGIIQPKLFRSTLVVSYRLFNDLPFSEAEQKELVRNWQAEYEAVDANETTKKTAIEHWLAARKKVTGDAAANVNPERSNPSNYSSFLNCTSGAFDTATKTLNARLEKLSADDANIKEWLKGQDMVFADCSDGKDIPSEVAKDAPDWLKDDRAYQIAAAYFYTMQYDAAYKRFSQLANNSASTWHDTATYVLARIALRQANALLGDSEQQAKMQSHYQTAAEQLNKVLADKNLSAFHLSAQSLLNMVLYRTQPEALHSALTKKLTDKNDNPTFFQDLTDYRYLLDRVSDDGYVESDKPLFPKFRQSSDLTDWIFTVQSKEKDAYSHALEKWQATKNTAWLIAALMKANSDSPEVAQLITAAKAIDKTSAAFLNATYHLVRLQTALGQIDEARNTLDSILADTSLNLSAKNLLLSERMILAKDLAEFVKFSQRTAAHFSYDQIENQLIDPNEPLTDGTEKWFKRIMFDEDATLIMNTKMPLAVLTDMALHAELPDYLRNRVVLSAWVRAVILNDEDTAIKLLPALNKAYPELKTSIISYNKAQSGKAKLYEATLCMLKNPAMRPLVDHGMGRITAFNDIDSFRDNWWCRAYSFTNQYPEIEGVTQPAPVIAPVFLTKEQLAAAKAENDKIVQIAVSGSDYLANKTSEWAAFAPNDKRLPEGLALAVRATRYGCDTCNTTKASKAAFDTLRERFANSEWKKKTPYWFKGSESCDKQ